FFNMSRYNSYVFFIYNAEEVKDIDKEHNNIFRYLEENLDFIIDFNLITSEDSNKYDEYTKKLKVSLEKLLPHVNFYELELRKACFENTIEIYNFRGDPERIIFNGDKSMEYIIPETFKGKEEILATNFRWISEIEIEGYLPLLNKKNKYIDDNFISDIRYSGKGIAFEAINNYIATNQKTVEALRHIRVIEDSLNVSIERILSEKGYNYSISNQGKYAMKILQKFDESYSELSEILKDNNYRKIFDQFINDDNVGRCIDKRKYLNLNNIMQITGKATTRIINNLINKGTLLRGFLVKCEECSHSFWISLNDISDYIECNQCGCKMFYTYNLSDFGDDSFEPVIYYKLDEIFYKAWVNNFDVPIISLDYLNKNKKNNFEYLPEVNIYDDDKLYCEIDFICNLDGKLILGECKSNNEIDLKQINKYKHIAIQTGADKIYFCTLRSEFNEASNKLINNLRDELGMYFGIEVEVLNESDLLY
ncbi:hypothetical protein, partial [Clostridium sp.]|uniref:hypothetical protein n=1 Tax=Clostridium sp. TaxID=1506 RepID=UPI00262F5C84